MLTPGRVFFDQLCQRAGPKGSHARSGMEAKISGSRAYDLLPTLYQSDRDRGFKGIPAGALATESHIERPWKECPRHVIHSLVFEVAEKETSSFTQKFFDYGNFWEDCALRFFHQAFGGLLFSGGRLDDLDPARGYGCATPDALWWDPKTDRVWCVEVKMPKSRTVQRSELRKEDVHYNILDPSEGFWQESSGPEEERGEPGMFKKDFPWIYVKYNDARYPANYVPQFIMEAMSAGVAGVKVVQVELGDSFCYPVLSVTDYLVDPRVHKALHEYWSAAWAIVLEGRAELKRILQRIEHAKKTDNLTDMVQNMEILDNFKKTFPWPAPSKGKPDKNCVKYMPYIFDKLNF